jgi:cell division protein FtsI (penicillin-binding protein 3)
VTLAFRQRRVGWLLLLFAVLLVIGLARALQLTTIDAGRLSGAAATEHTATIVVPAPRGEIEDRNGVILAVDEAADDISATPQLVRDPAAAAAKLAPLLGLPAGAIESQLAHPASPQYALLARQVPQAAAQKVAALRIPGVALTSDPLRFYPGNGLAAQLLGGVGADGNGLSGVELDYNKELEGTPGVQHVVFDAHGQPISCPGKCTTAVPGTTVQLTIDAALQQEVEHVIDQTAGHFHPLDALAIVMDPQTDTILAMANWPRVNANDPSSVGLAENYATELNYEPGSTFKVVAVGGALSEGLISPTTSFTIPYCIQVANYCIHDSDYHATERLRTSQILAQSSNVGAIRIGERLLRSSSSTNEMYDWMIRYGFGSTTGIDLPGEEQGIVPAPSTWSGSSIGNLPIGQGVLVTPIQMASAYATIANGGLWRSPRLVQSVGGVPVPEAHARRILSEKVSAELRRMLEGVLLPGGTASEIKIPGYELAGKTGTASKIVNGHYSQTQYVASFVGFAPASDPKVEALVVVDRPSTGYVYGTEVAAPAWKQIMNFALPYLGVAPH